MTKHDGRLHVGQGVQEWLWAMTGVSRYAASPEAAKMIFEWAIVLEQILFYGGNGPTMYDMIWDSEPEEGDE